VGSFLARGSLAHCALEIVDALYPDVSVWSVPFIKPIDIDQVVNICSTSSAIISFEEHSVYGGLGSLIAEIASQNSPVHILPIGVRDRFLKKCGSYEYLLNEHEINRFSIEKQIKNFLSKLNQSSNY
jgi:transketolase